ncbi:MAG: substrate-binding domain-containing protein [Clostridia bacterium]|nr:substrate-binding domain-containing protein [Clostridia bacterium]
MTIRRIVLILMLCLIGVLNVEAEGSWGQINQELTRPADWKQIVSETGKFSLGGTITEEKNYNVRSWGTYPSLDGSTVCVPMAMEFARQWLGLSEEDLGGFVSFSTTPNAYDRLIKGQANPLVMIASQNTVLDDEHPIDIVIGTEANKDEKTEAADAGKRLVFIPVCYDAFVFFVNENNPVSGLTSDQIRDIYSGETVPVAGEYYEVMPYIQSWDQVGGESYDIIAYQRPHGSGSQTAMEELVMKDREIMTATENIMVGGMADIIQRIGNYDNDYAALGYSYLYYISSLYVDDGIKVLAIDGIEPTEENIRTQKYPYTVSYYAVFDENNDIARKFVDWMISDEGQSCIRLAGYIALR